MTIQEKTGFIAQKLLELYPNPAVPLHHKDPFTLLVAVLLSAQCTDERVNQVTDKLFALADHPAAMIRIGVERIEEIIRPCGISKNKSKAIHRLSEMLMAEYGGAVPQDMAEMEKLPGVGHKTASVVMIQAFGMPAFPVDTHIHRLAERWGLSNGTTVEKTEADLKTLFPEKDWALLHLRIIYFGREYCKARGHNPNQCPICSAVGEKNR
jgi:endonuclease III